MVNTQRLLLLVHGSYTYHGVLTMELASCLSLNSPPRLHVTANLPPVISFSSASWPQLSVCITLEYSQPIIIVLKTCRLWPLHLQSALTLHNVSSGQHEYLPHVDVPFRNAPIPPLDAEHKDAFVGLKPGETSIVSVFVRPYDEPYNYDKIKKSRR